MEGQTKKQRKEKTEISPEKIKELIVELYTKGNTPEKIGRILKEQYNISVKEVAGKKIMKILREKGLKVFPTDLENVINRLKKLKEHYAKHKHDYKAKRAISILEARARILSEYYKRKGILPQDFKVKV
jgi:small subunit ribosomal protein S15